MTGSESPYILIIEDDADTIKLIQRMLQTQHMHVQGAPDGGTGLAMMYERRPDAVLLDLMLPDMVGWEVCQEMQADLLLRSVPVIVRSPRRSVVGAFRAFKDPVIVTSPTLVCLWPRRPVAVMVRVVRASLPLTTM